MLYTWYLGIIERNCQRKKKIIGGFMLWISHALGLCRVWGMTKISTWGLQNKWKNFIKKKIANPSTLGCTVGAKSKNQNYNDEVKQEEKNKNNATKPHSKQGVCKKKDLISSKERSHPSKHLAFLSLQIHYIKQCGTSLQKSILWCRPNLPCQDSKHPKYLKWHNPMESKQTKHQRPQLKSYGAMK